MGMAASLETRVPFLDHELVEFSARLPRHLKIHHGWNVKYVLKRSMRGLLPQPILSRRKRGFPVPLDRWFRGPFRPVLDEYVLGDRARQRGLFEHDYLERLVRAHQGGARHGYRLWVLIGLELWARRFLDGEEPALR
jgi:asparagine synthase (glutamine-hydrolysing)